MPKKNPVKNGCLFGCSAVFLIFMVGLIILCIHTFILFSHARKGILNTDEAKGREEFTVDLTVEEGSSLRKISEQLHELGIVESPFFFRWKAQAEGDAAEFSYGEFELSNYMTYDQVAELLKSPVGSENFYRFTVIEGQSILEIAEKLEKEGICSYNEFMDVCENGEFDYDFIKEIPERKNRLEGYLFPDTYFIGFDDEPWDIVNSMLSNFNDRVYEGLYSSSSTEYSFDEIVIMASIIEKEIRVDSERPIAASVIINRLNSGMRLQMDATVLYAKQEHKGRVYYSDTEIDSDYNTYQKDGLPIGPIGNAGLASFEGALNPADTDYIFYVVSDTSTGEHYFTDDYDDFLNAKNRYISGL